MEAQGLIERRRRKGQTNEFLFSGLKAQAKPFAEEHIDEQQRRARKTRRTARTTKPNAV
jgi:hypothetical protein